jgi:hypothetical protein
LGRFTAKELAHIAETAGNSKLITTTVATAITVGILLKHLYIFFHYTIILPIHQVRTGPKQLAIKLKGKAVRGIIKTKKNFLIF